MTVFELILILLLLGVFHVLEIKWLVLIFVLFLLGCAAQEPSSTDNHHRLPEINCTQKMYQGRYHRFCCEGETCVFTD